MGSSACFDIQTRPLPVCQLLHSFVILLFFLISQIFFQNYSGLFQIDVQFLRSCILTSVFLAWSSETYSPDDYELPLGFIAWHGRFSCRWRSREMRWASKRGCVNLTLMLFSLKYFACMLDGLARITLSGRLKYLSDPPPTSQPGVLANNGTGAPRRDK